MSKGCPHCGKAPYPIKNDDGTINWKNVFHIDWIAVFMVISILLLIFGVKQINQQCLKIVADPCGQLKGTCSDNLTRTFSYSSEVYDSVQEERKDLPERVPG